ncbi:MAG: response regulator transcription factor [Gammaproteobacteria bacterium]|nr:response regulator transcription factor [Gammaproteobacteria bacterium]
MHENGDSPPDNAIRVGILEDDLDQAEYYKTLLEDRNYKVTHCVSGLEFIRLIQSKGFDFLILDWDVPVMDGLDVLKWVRSNLQWEVPTLFLTITDAEESIVEALEAGADDYLTKPIKPKEFLARVAAVARRAGLGPTRVDKIAIGDYVLDHKLQQCFKSGELVKLTNREFELAFFLFENQGKILSREYLLNRVWSISASVNTRTVDTHISRLRSKLELFPENSWQLSSVYHFGYRLEQLD